jgi:hypothetical protein
MLVSIPGADCLERALASTRAECACATLVRFDA